MSPATLAPSATAPSGAEASREVGSAAQKVVAALREPEVVAPPEGWLATEMHDMVDVISPAFGLRVFVGVLLSIALYRAVAFGPRLLWRMGLDRERRAAPIAAIFGLFVLLGGVVWTFRPVFRAAPSIALMSGALLVLAAALALPKLVQSLLTGVRLAARGRLIEGQQIEIEGVRGAVRRIGLLETALRTSDGATVHLPNHLFSEAKLKVLRAQHAAPVDVTVKVEGELTDAQLQRLRAAVFLSPYRRAGTRPTIDERERDRGRVTVHLQTWATRDVDLVCRALRRIMLSSLEGEGGEDGE